MTWKDVVYGMTGGIASGKSTVARLLEERGAIVIDADQIAREAVAPGTDTLAQIVDTFGPDVLDTDGALRREVLGAKVFGDNAAREKLNAIVHPEVARRSAAALGAAFQTEGRPIFYDAALLVETGRHRDFAGLIVVSASPEQQRERLMARDGLTDAEADARLNAQLPLEEKLAVADFVVDNSGPEGTLPSRVDALLEAMKNREETDA